MYIKILNLIKNNSIYSIDFAFDRNENFFILWFDNNQLFDEIVQFYNANSLIEYEHFELLLNSPLKGIGITSTSLKIYYIGEDGITRGFNIDKILKTIESKVYKFNYDNNNIYKESSIENITYFPILYHPYIGNIEALQGVSIYHSTKDRYYIIIRRDSFTILYSSILKIINEHMPEY